MRDLLLLAVQLIITLAKLARPGGVRSVIAESLLLKQQVLVALHVKPDKMPELKRETFTA
jgi:hypothetical protein